MGNKYYTPELSEFCEEFEFEECIDGKTWDKERSYTPNEFIKNNKFELQEWISENRIRVKYLDQQDIEECGFGLKRRLLNTKKIHYRGILFGNENYNIMLYLDNNIKITTSYGDTLFQGIIKNKTEFKKLLTQLGIK